MPKQRRTGLFSATQTREVADLIRAGLRSPVHIAVKERALTASDVEQKTPATLRNYYMVDVTDCLLSMVCVLNLTLFIIYNANYLQMFT